ncbi:MAG: asparagine synthetase B, partial [Phototrophicales bacterium]
MCGICGYLSYKVNIQERKHILNRMCELVTHRGPDDHGIYVAGNVGLGHRRLSIIDLSSGHQPMQNDDGSLCIVFNGEIYNFPEVKHQLQSKGFSFRTRSDTEVILKGYEYWGFEVLERLN